MDSQNSFQKSIKNSSVREQKGWIIDRRDFLKISGLTASGVFAGLPVINLNNKPKLRFGIVTDSHYADIEAGTGDRYYRESLTKMAECVDKMNEEKVDFLIELGDFKDMSKPVSKKETIKYLDAIEKEFKQFRGPRYHVLGNHDMDCISKEQFLSRIKNSGISKKSKYYSFDKKGIHFVVLDANYLPDGSDYDSGNFNWTNSNIPKEELEWLEKDLTATDKPVIIFVHQLLDGVGDPFIKNAAVVRSTLKKYKNVIAVFQGHEHKGRYSEIEGIHYYTLKAMVVGSGTENNSFAIVDVYDDYLTVTGYRNAVSKTLQ